MQDYQKNFTVNKPLNEVYDAVTKQIADWWSNDLSGAATEVGDSFDIAFGKTHKTFTIVEAVPNKRIVWQCVKAYIAMASLQNKAEWEGTKMIWTLTATEQGTNLNFLHQGLNESFECYDVCEQGWDMFLASLEIYVNTGKGAPYLKTLAKSDLEEANN